MQMPLGPLCAIAMAMFTLGSCCAPPIGKQLREELLVTRGSKILMGGSVSMPAFTDPTAIELLVDGTSEERVFELVGPPSRRLPASEGELWLWEMAVFQQHVLLAVNLADGRQRGPAIAEWRTIPDFLLHRGFLDLVDDVDVTRLVDILGSASRTEIVRGHSVMVWEAALRFEPHEGAWRYSPDVYLHTLRLEVVGDRLESVGSIESRKLEGWPPSAVQRLAATGTM